MALRFIAVVMLIMNIFRSMSSVALMY